MIEAVVFILEIERRCAHGNLDRDRELRPLYPRKGKAPWVTIGAKLATEPERFERVAPGLYQLRVTA